MGRQRPEDRLLAELASWGGTFWPGLERRGVLHTDDGLEVELIISVRRHTGAAQGAQLREEALAWLRESPFSVPNAIEAERCGCYLKSGGHCEGQRIVAVVVYHAGFTDKHCFRFICGRHRKTHGIDSARIVGVVELPEHTLLEAHDLVKRWKAARDAKRKALVLEHHQGAHGLLPAGAALVERCPTCEDLQSELSQCRSHSPQSGGRCFEDLGHSGAHRRRAEEWTSDHAHERTSAMATESRGPSHAAVRVG
jgi:hypothetical protein